MKRGMYCGALRNAVSVMAQRFDDRCRIAPQAQQALLPLRAVSGGASADNRPQHRVVASVALQCSSAAALRASRESSRECSLLTASRASQRPMLGMFARSLSESALPERSRLRLLGSLRRRHIASASSKARRFAMNSRSCCERFIHSSSGDKGS